uniref:Hsp20/alpha crystallin family protein n=1 Tax=Janthinobacterium sp. TaxID=1871054 RepID=UPI0026302D8B
MANQLSTRDRFSPVARFDPFSDMDELMRDFFSPVLRLRETAAPHIRVDISETEQAYQVQADIPGVNKDDIKVSIDGSRVSISAEIKDARVTRDNGGKTILAFAAHGLAA